jgi:hypothetical protein
MAVQPEADAALRADKHILGIDVLDVSGHVNPDSPVPDAQYMTLKWQPRVPMLDGQIDDRSAPRRQRRYLRDFITLDRFRSSHRNASDIPGTPI